MIVRKKMSKLLLAGALILSNAGGAAFAATVATETVLTLDGAQRVAAGAEEKATADGARVVIVVVDRAGIPILLKRLDGTQVASVNVAIDKARTAAIYRRPSRDFETQVTEGRASAMQLHGAVALAGGIPITINGEVVGAIGVSGETPRIDEDIAIAGATVASEFTTSR
jgi:glc operon protein GlcG